MLAFVCISRSIFSSHAPPKHGKRLSKLWAREPHICFGFRVKVEKHRAPP